MQPQTKSKIYLFHHITQINHWQEILQEQIKLLITSGLYDAASKIYYSLATQKEQPINLPDKYQRIITAPLNTYEVPLIKELHEQAKLINTPSYFCYFHLKGVSYPKGNSYHENTVAWRKTMQKVVIKNWRYCVSYLVEGYDTVGCEWHGKPYNHITVNEPHWHGNFWWASSEYLKTLPDVYDCDGWGEHKCKAEVWLGSNKKARIKSLMQFNKDLQRYKIDKSIYS